MCGGFPWLFIYILPQNCFIFGILLSLPRKIPAASDFYINLYTIHTVYLGEEQATDSQLQIKNKDTSYLI